MAVFCGIKYNTAESVVPARLAELSVGLVWVFDVARTTFPLPVQVSAVNWLLEFVLVAQADAGTLAPLTCVALMVLVWPELVAKVVRLAVV